MKGLASKPLSLRRAPCCTGRSQSRIIGREGASAGECLNKAPLPPLISGTCAETQAATIAIHPHLLDAAMTCMRSAFHLGGITFRRPADVSPEPLRVCSLHPPQSCLINTTDPAGRLGAYRQAAVSVSTLGEALQHAENNKLHTFLQKSPPHSPKVLQFRLQYPQRS